MDWVRESSHVFGYLVALQACWISGDGAAEAWWRRGFWWVEEEGREKKRNREIIDRQNREAMAMRWKFDVGFMGFLDCMILDVFV